MKSYQPVAEQPDPAAEAAKQAEDVAAIKRLNDDRKAASDAGDASTHAALYTDDAILMPPNRPAVVGREALLARWEAMYERHAASRFTRKFTEEVLEVEVAGDWAFMRTAGTVTLTPKAGGEPIEYSGKTLAILKRQPDGAWKCYRTMGHTDRPLPGVIGDN